MEKIKRFFECLIPVTLCNLRCSYCYVIQEGNRSEAYPELRYSASEITRALSRERLGGCCYFSICGAGETLIPKELPLIAQGILENGHYVNLTTNGTITPRFQEFAAFPPELIKRLHFAFSFHYLELLRVGKLEEFWANVETVKKMGASFLIQFNLCDEYLPHLEEIRHQVREHTGAEPQVVLTRDESISEFKILSDLKPEEYKAAGDVCRSRLFDFTFENFRTKRRNFCYAGDWSGVLNLATGELQKCYCSPMKQNIFEAPERPIRFEAIGNNCTAPYCVNSSHFLSLGVIRS